jgi:hypothetical protein
MLHNSNALDGLKSERIQHPLTIASANEFMVDQRLNFSAKTCTLDPREKIASVFMRQEQKGL